ncbi:hypothetical protein QM467_11435 [Rhodoblastus sp. 17X3]|uniref:hypothetical protein n=1 Tax=Rhodoblastus sp. 17X3 TaxID=3047026 RepID=UPI0024B6BB77|nr:hypothetical protein [Rhodoblastus sp. 17X3]MDI9848667.1 hypothetical protein [Rhodoblastus sp. 17X3]
MSFTLAPSKPWARKTWRAPSRIWRALLSLADFAPVAAPGTLLREARFRRTEAPLLSFVMARSKPAVPERGPPAGGGLRRRLAPPLIQPIEMKTITPDGANDGKRINGILMRASRFCAAFYLTEPFGSSYESEIFSLLRQIFSCARRRALLLTCGVQRRSFRPPARRNQINFQGFGPGALFSGIR